MKKLGVIGGLGPMATAYFFELVIRMTDAKTDQEHIEIWIHNCPSIPDRTAYLFDHTKENPVSLMLASGRELSRQGVDIIAIPCITAHYFHEELTRKISVPIIHAIEETVCHLKKYHKKTIGILATDGTVASGLFQKELEKNHMDWILPDKECQQYVMDLIYKDVKAGEHIEIDKFYKVTDMLRQKGAETILLGCTELSLIKREFDVGEGVLDAMEVLAKCSVERCGAPLKETYRCLIT